ncbi:hypothetical protein [Maribacter sp. 2304DJ31-5]|uniref:hypothetical protein n=1 Tax=Maribacter sp. 2304DJ31-5 TaxID=3386273 RepID=UPI0039BD1D19
MVSLPTGCQEACAAGVTCRFCIIGSVNGSAKLLLAAVLVSFGSMPTGGDILVVFAKG